MGPDDGEEGVPRKAAGRIIRSDGVDASREGEGQDTREWTSTAQGAKLNKSVDELDTWEGFDTKHAKGAASPGDVVDGWDTSEMDADWEVTKKPKWLDRSEGKDSPGSGEAVAEWHTGDRPKEWVPDESGAGEGPAPEWRTDGVPEEPTPEWSTGAAPEAPVTEWETDGAAPQPEAEWQAPPRKGNEWERTKKSSKSPDGDEVEWGS